MVVKNRLTKRVRRKHNDYEQVESFQLLNLETRQDAERFIDYRLEPLLSFANAFSNVFVAPGGSLDKAFAELLKVWADARNNGDPYRDDKYDRVFRVRTHYSHQMTAAARAIAAMKFLMLRSKRVAIRRQSLRRQNMRSMMLRCL